MYRKKRRRLFFPENLPSSVCVSVDEAVLVIEEIVVN
jgi:hypothetical protein